MRNTDEPVVIEETFIASIDTVWKAITVLDQMKQWFFGNIGSFKPEVGFETKFEVQGEDRKFTHLWKLTEVIPRQKITYNWKYEEYPGDSFVTFELAEKDSCVELRLMHRVVDSFPSDIPEFSRENCFEGWNYFIGKNLREYLRSISKSKHVSQVS